MTSRLGLRLGLRCTALALGLAMAGTLVACAGSNSATSRMASGDAGTRTALLVFVDYKENVDPVASPATLRIAGAQGVSAWLEHHGLDVLTYPEIEPAMRKGGVRSADDLPSLFLETLGSDHSIDHVLVARLVIYRDRVLLLARGLACGTGLLQWADAAEVRIDAAIWSQETGAAQWTGVVRKLAGKLQARWSPIPSEDTASTVVLLPLRRIGVGELPAELANHALLRALLVSRHHRVLDPALVQTALRDQGHDPHLLDGSGRAEIVSRFAPSLILAPELVAFESTPSAAVRPGDEFADGEPSPNSTSRLPLYLQLLAIDVDTGQVRSANAVYLEPDDPVGLFGVSRKIPLARRFERGAEQITRSLDAKGGSI